MAIPTVAECRTILGASAEGMTDEEIERERDQLSQLASIVFDQFRTEVSRDPDAMRHLLDAHANGIDTTEDARLAAVSVDWLADADDDLWTIDQPEGKPAVETGGDC